MNRQTEKQITELSQRIWFDGLEFMTWAYSLRPTTGGTRAVVFWATDVVKQLKRLLSDRGAISGLRGIQKGEKR